MYRENQQREEEKKIYKKFFFVRYVKYVYNGGISFVKYDGWCYLRKPVEQTKIKFEINKNLTIKN